MKIGIPTETKIAEKRVALTPEDCGYLVSKGIDVHIQSGAGVCAGYEDGEYQEVGCVVMEDAERLYGSADLIVKVKEPLEGDLKLLEKRHTLFCYLHLAAEPQLVETLKEIGLKAYAFETVVEDGATPLLAPMSAIAGRLSVQLGTRFLHASQGGRGTLLGGIQGKSSGNVTVVGAGVAGQEAARLAYGMGAHVTVLDINEGVLNAVKTEMPKADVQLSTSENLEKLLPETDVLVGAVYVVGRKAPHVVTSEQIQLMPKGSVVVDISIDQGGCIQTSKPCTHAEPTFERHGVIHSAITNLPAAAPRTASQILSEAILPYVEQLVGNRASKSLEKAVNVDNGELKIQL